MSNTSLNKDLVQARRQQLRQDLRTAHLAWCAQPQAREQQQALTQHLAALLATLDPSVLGVYWPLPGEYDPTLVALQALATGVPLALPWAFKPQTGQQGGPNMVFRQWHGQMPSNKDECGIPSPSTCDTTPDVLLVPCLGFTTAGWRLGHGKGYYDRYLTAHPHVTAIGVAWSHALLNNEQLMPQPHDQAMMLVVTPEGIIGPD